MTPAALFTLLRVAGRPEGAFGVLLFGDWPFALTIERTYPDAPKPCCHRMASGQYVKLPPGRYRCTRSVFLKGGYATFEIHVEGHERILFHKGNREEDFDGCIGIGESFHDFGPAPGVAASAAGFREFMVRAADLALFDLDVVDP